MRAPGARSAASIADNPACPSAGVGMKVLESILVVTPISKVVSAFERLLAEHGYACRTELLADGFRLIASDGRFAVDLIQDGRRGRVTALR